MTDTLTVYEQLEQRSPEWYEARRGLVTASTVGRLLTSTLRIAQNDISRGLLHTLAAERITGHVEETPMTWQMWRGVEDEPRARDLYAAQCAPVEEVGFMVREITPGIRLGYSPDGLVGDDGLIEVKSRSPRHHLATILSGGVPAEHMAQVQAGLLVSGRAWCDYISWCGGMRMWTCRVTPDPRWQEVLHRVVEAAEHGITDAVEAYESATEGMPDTERAVDLAEEIVI